MVFERSLDYVPRMTVIDNISHPHTQREELPDGSAHFGFRTVPEDEKIGLVRGVFDAVAPKYDLMNDLMSAGVHRLWKSAMINCLAPRKSEAIADLAGGTGDIAFRILGQIGRGAFPVTVCDINTEMLGFGRDRAINRGYLSGLNWVCGNAESLPFPDMRFDACTIAFGLRNVTHIDKALIEARRVLKPGGRFLCLEFSKVVLPMLDKLYDAYSFAILPKLGEVIAGDRQAYTYLAESIRRFPDQQSLVAHMAAAGFSQIKVQNLSGGIAAIHTGWRT